MKETIESIVANHFGVTPEQLRAPRSDSQNTADARHFLWYFLCYVLGYKPAAVAEEYNTSRRNVSLSVVLIRDGIQIQPALSRHCAEITKQLKELNLL